MKDPLLLPSIQVLSEIDPDGECPQYPREDWIAEVSGGDTQLGYWHWVSHRVEASDAPPAGEVEVLVEVAAAHGRDSEPDHEVGDLQEYLRAAFALLSPEQRAAFFASDKVRETLTAAVGV